MERDDETFDDVIELGAASTETKGPPDENLDFVGGRIQGGISND